MSASLDAACRRLAPGACIGVLGGGQLGRMTAFAASRLGYRTHVFCPEEDGPCAQVATRRTIAGFSDYDALADFADQVDVVTLEWENIPVEAVAFLEARVPICPGAAVLATCQDRREEKRLFDRLGVPTALWRAARSKVEVAAAVADLGAPVVVKTARLGYDGKGQARIVTPEDVEAGWRRVGGVEGQDLPIIVESVVDFTCEISVIVARGQNGAMTEYPAVENQHRNHILDKTVAPARISAKIAETARDISRLLAESLNVVGLLAVEMFVVQDGGVLVNELAPRPHNSGHWTIDACHTSQFEQLVRIACGLPLGSTERFADAEMENLIGDAVCQWPELLAEPEARLHLYGKNDVRPGRKMGHVTRLHPLRQTK
ncbi:N5-carboxyaminoimidazole ribonucleotide synthase [Azospirillaceae bacterium]